MTKDQLYMKRCLQIAQNGIGLTRPNPSVGAVIVYDDAIIGEGFTSPFGGNHAEVNAVNSIKKKELLKNATIYVTLEPCSHFGKTPPCSDLIIKHQLKRVVIGCLDSNPLVAGKGIEKLKNAKIDVTVGILEDECRQHHKRFFTVQEKSRPYIILKWAETKNGFIAPEKKEEKAPVWISNSYSQQLVHKLRAKEHAILVGTNTVLEDNPSLTVRSWSGNNPVRIVLDRNLKIPKNYNVYNNNAPTIFLIDKSTEIPKLQQNNLLFEQIDFSKNLAKQVCDVLMTHKIQSVVIEGGAKTLQTFIDENLWDEALVFVGNSIFENGTKAPKFSSKITSEINIKGDLLKHYYND